MLFLLFQLIKFSELYARQGSFGTSGGGIIGADIGSALQPREFPSIGTNPGMLDFIRDKKTGVSILLPNTSLHFFSNSLSLNQINYYFGGKNSRKLNETEKNDLLNYFSGDSKIGFGFSLNLITLSLKPMENAGTFAVSMNDYFSGRLNFPQSLPQLALKGNEKGRTYSFDGFSFEICWLREYSLSYSRTLFDSSDGFLKRLTGGVTLRFINGFVYAGSRNVNASLYTGQENEITLKLNSMSYSAFSRELGVNYSYENGNTGSGIAFPTPAGYGYGFDLGFAAETKNGLLIGISLMDLGQVFWREHTAKHISEGDIVVNDLFDSKQQKALTDSIKTISSAIDGFDTPLPLNFRLAIAYDLKNQMKFIPGELWSSFNYCQGLNNTMLNSTAPHFSAGLAWLPGDNLPYVSTGISNDSDRRMRWSAGAGFLSGFADMYIGTSDILSLFKNANKPDFSISFSVLLKVGRTNEEQ